MTRFTRAKGSKSSNEKKPEEATSWSEMKNSMLPKKLNEPEKPLPKIDLKTDTGKPTEWASLGDNFNSSVSLIKQHLNKKKNNKRNSSDNSSLNVIKNKKKKLKENDSGRESKLTEDGDSVIKRKNKKQKCLISEEIDSEISKNGVKKNKKKRKLQDGLDSEIVLPMKKKKYFNHNQNLEVDKQKSENLPHKGKEQFQKVKNKIKSRSKMGGATVFDKKFNKQLKDKKKFRSRGYEEKNSAIEELIINGEKIHIIKFQGFNVTLEDAERLKKLRSEMIKEGIPKAKLEAAIKLERRRAEKALSRLKKSVCFHCRGHGHLLSNCPSLIEKENTSTGICYKCGSTEHSAFDCKVVRGTNFQFAECFICKEQGHIARQCPDNPRGLYPQGGACRECGDVTHLRKDCPQVQTQKADEIVTVGMRNDRNLECLDEEIHNREKQNSPKKLRKSSTVKF